MNVTNIDTADLNWNAAPPASLVGQAVRITQGPLDGIEGVVVECPAVGCVRIELSEGVYVETSHVIVIPALSSSLQLDQQS